MKQIKRISVLLAALMILIQLFFSSVAFAKDDLIDELKEMSTEIINWKKSEFKVSSDDNLLKNQFLENAGLSSGDWFPLGIGRLGVEDDYDAYLAMIDENITKRYKSKAKLDRVKATEWHRVALAVLATGGDPTQIGLDESIDLIADGTYNRSKEMDIGAQGTNGLSWGLLALDSMRYKVPKDAADSREDLIERILVAQLEDGGFSLKLPPSEVDITAMVLQALAPYYNSEKVYTYTREIDNKKREVRVRDVVDEALKLLSNKELDSTESIVQVIVALTALQIDPLSKEFGKDDQTLFDMLKEYQLEDGGFIHSESDDEENLTANPDESNSMASEQALYGLTAMLRYYTGSRSLYDFRPENSSEIAAQIRNVESEIDRALKQQDMKILETVYDHYLKIPAEERSYVSNYAELSDALTTANIELEIDDLNETMEINTSGNGSVTELLTESNNQSKEMLFTKADAKRTSELIKETSTQFKVEVIKLLDVLNNAQNKTEFENELVLLKNEKRSIEDLEAEIDALNKLIMTELYPFEKITARDEAVVKQITNTYNELPEYDQTQIQNYEDVKKAETQIQNLKRAKYIKIIGFSLVILLSGYLFYRAKKRKKEKLRQKMLEDNE